MMHQRTQELPVTMEAPGMKGHNAIWGGMAIGYLFSPEQEFRVVSEHIARQTGQSA